MINEVLFMELRLMRLYCEKHHLSGREVNNLFESHGIWDYIEKCYDALHVSSDECALKEIESFIFNKE